MKQFVISFLVVAVFIAVFIYARYAVYTSDLPLWFKIMLLK